MELRFRQFVFFFVLILSGPVLAAYDPTCVATALKNLKANPVESFHVADDVYKAPEEVADQFYKALGEVSNPGKFKIIVDPKEALAARVLMIRKATDSIDMTYYIFKDSESSRILIGELKEALRRGVNVRLMVDGTGTISSSFGFIKELQTLKQVKKGARYNSAGEKIGEATFEAAVINPLLNVRANIKEWGNTVSKLVTGKETPLDHFSFFQRSHDKIILVDAAIPEKTVAIVGGRNISNNYFGIGKAAKDIYNDVDIIIKGTSKKTVTNGVITVENSLQDHFNKLYLYTANKKFNDFIFKIDRSKAAEQLLKIRKDRNANIKNPDGELVSTLNKLKADDYFETGFDTGHVRILDEYENLIRKNPLSSTAAQYSNVNSVMKNMWEQINMAKSDILISSPYLYLTDSEILQLTKWLQKDPSRKLRILTNSSVTSDNIFAQSMTEHFVMPKLLDSFKNAKIPPSQFEIYAYGTLDHKKLGGLDPQGTLHAKFWMVDNKIMGVGTSNFDPLSRLTNSEVMANVVPISGRASSEALNTFYNDLKSKSTLWSSDDFIKVKNSPELKRNVFLQKVIAKIIDKADVLPQ